MHPAMDLTAGEKERGTMETILSSPISRSHLVLASSCWFSQPRLPLLALSVISMASPSPSPMPCALLPFKLASKVLPCISEFARRFPFSSWRFRWPVLFSSVLITISTFAKSYKEAQS